MADMLTVEEVADAMFKIVSDAHGQRRTFHKLLQDKYLGETTNLESVTGGRLQLLLLGSLQLGLFDRGGDRVVEQGRGRVGFLRLVEGPAQIALHDPGRLGQVLDLGSLLSQPLHGRVGLGRVSKSMRLLSIRVGCPPMSGRASCATAPGRCAVKGKLILAGANPAR